MSAPNYPCNAGAQVNQDPLFYSALEIGSGDGTAVTSPLSIVSTASGYRSEAIIQVSPNGSVNIAGSSTNPVYPNAITTIGSAGSPNAVTITYDLGADEERLTVGRPGVSGLQLTGGSAGNDAMSIVGNNAVATNTITIGPNSNAPACVVVGPGNSFTMAASPYTTQVVIPQVVGNILQSTGVVLTNPGTAGLYYIAASCSTLDGYSVASQISTIAFYDGAKWKVGGAADAVNGTGGISFSPAPGTAATINFFNNSGNNLVNMSFVRLPLFNGLITGFP